MCHKAPSKIGAHLCNSFHFKMHKSGDSVWPYSLNSVRLSILALLSNLQPNSSTKYVKNKSLQNIEKDISRFWKRTHIENPKEEGSISATGDKVDTTVLLTLIEESWVDNSRMICQCLYTRIVLLWCENVNDTIPGGGTQQRHARHYVRLTKLEIKLIWAEEYAWCI